MGAKRKIKIEDHMYSQWPHWLYIPVERDIWNGSYSHLTRGTTPRKIREELQNKNVVFRFNILWEDAPGFFSGRRKNEAWYRYKFKNKGDRLIFLMTYIGENVE